MNALTFLRVSLLLIRILKDHLINVLTSFWRTIEEVYSVIILIFLESHLEYSVNVFKVYKKFYKKKEKKNDCADTFTIFFPVISIFKYHLFKFISLFLNDSLWVYFSCHFCIWLIVTFYVLWVRNRVLPS